MRIFAIVSPLGAPASCSIQTQLVERNAGDTKKTAEMINRSLWSRSHLVK